MVRRKRIADEPEVIFLFAYLPYPRQVEVDFSSQEILSGFSSVPERQYISIDIV
jgi:hypothetical protein